MSILRKLVILDDDPHYAGMLGLKIRHEFPELAVSSCTKGDVPAGYDIYILDNDFNGMKMGAKLAESARTLSPKSLVVVMSGTLEISLLKRLVNCHAAGVFDKSEVEDMSRMFTLIQSYIQEPQKVEKPASPSLKGTLKGISALLSEWNDRLAYEEKR